VVNLHVKYEVSIFNRLRDMKGVPKVSSARTMLGQRSFPVAGPFSSSDNPRPICSTSHVSTKFAQKDLLIHYTTFMGLRWWAGDHRHCQGLFEAMFGPKFGWVTW